MKFKTGEKLLLIFIMLIAAILFYGSSIVKVAFDESITPKMFGRVISGLLFVICCIRLVKLFTTKDEKTEAKLVIPELKIIITQMILMVAYTIGLTTIGYYVTTFVYLFAMIVILTDNHTKKSIVTYGVGSFIFTAALYLVFTAFNVFLPNAWLF